MSKREKLRERLKNNPTNATFSDIWKLLEQEGFALDRVTGSHHSFKKDETIFAIPVHNKFLSITKRSKLSTSSA
jgi:predicted RNA binding protein YcfA (HicA-like mRNA interferase family)